MNVEAQPFTAEANGAAAPRRKLLLRLDDGSLIGRASDLGAGELGERVIRLGVDQLAALGRAGDKEVQRLQAILDRLRNTYGCGPSAPLVQHGSIPPIKKTRAESLQAPLLSGGPAPGAWLPKCREILNKVFKHLGINRDAFYFPVNPKLLPDYYTVVKEPLFLDEIEARLARGHYQQPLDFASDMRHHFANVKLYNPEGDPFRAIGMKAEDFFEQAWAGTGFTNERTKRATAGLAAPKFDPERFEAPAKPRPARSHQGMGGGVAGGGGGGAIGKRSRDGGMRAPNHEATSGKPGFDDMGRLTQARIQEMGQYLSREDLPDEQSNHLLTLLPQHMMAGIESGEIELDFEALDNDTLMRIDAWLRMLPEAQAAAAAAAGMELGMQPMLSPMQQPSVRVDSYDDDEDYEEPDSDESD